MHHFDWFVRNRENTLALFRSFLQSNSTKSEPKAIDKMRTMYKACMDMDTEQMGKDENIKMTIDFLNQLVLPIYPTAIRSSNPRLLNEKSMKNLDWIKSIARIKKITGLDVIIGFDIKPDPTNQTRNHIWLGPRQKTSLLYGQFK